MKKPMSTEPKLGTCGWTGKIDVNYNTSIHQKPHLKHHSCIDWREVEDSMTAEQWRTSKQDLTKVKYSREAASLFWNDERAEAYAAHIVFTNVRAKTAERKLAELEKVLAECLPILHGAVAHFKYKQASLAEQYEAVTKRAEAALASLRAESKEG